MQFLQEVYKKFSDYKHHSNFRDKYNPQEREAKRKKIQSQFGDDTRQLVSIVLQKAEKSKIKFPKPYILFGINRQATLFDLRRKVSSLLGMNQKQSLFLICGSLIPNTNQRIKQLQAKKQSDGFIYLVCCEFDVFG